jgi:hypothetical protein
MPKRTTIAKVAKEVHARQLDNIQETMSTSSKFSIIKIKVHDR